MNAPDPAPLAAPAPPAAPRRRLLKRVLIFSALAVAILVLLVPVVAEGWAEGLLTEELEKNLEVRTQLESFSLGLGGGVNIRGLSIDDLSGRPVLAVDRLDVELSLLGAIRGRIEADVVIEGVELHLRQEDGVWNLASLPRERRPVPVNDEPRRPVARPTPEPGRPAGDTRDPNEELPIVRGSVRLADVRVVVHGTESTSELYDLGLTAELDGLDQPATFSFSTRLRGPIGDGGRVVMSGEAVPIGGDAASLELEVEDLLLAALEPLLVLVAPVEAIEGTIDGSAQLAVLGAEAGVRGSIDLGVAGLSVAGTQPDAAPFTLDSITLTARADDVAQELELVAGDLLRFDYRGTTRLSESAQAIAGELSLQADAAGLMQVAALWAPAREGRSVTGRLVGTAALDLDTSRGGPLPGTLVIDVSAQDVAARDAEGRLLDLGALGELRVALAAAGDAAGFALRDIEAAIGPVALAGEVHVTGLEGDGGDLDLTGTRLALDADLAALSESLAQIVDMADTELAGALSWTVEGGAASGGEGAAAIVTSTLVSTDLVVAGHGFAGGPVTTRTRFVADAAGELGLQGELEAASIVVTPIEGAPLVGAPLVGAPLVQRDIRVDYALLPGSASGAPDELAVTLTTSTVRATIASVAGETTEDRAVYDLSVTSDLARVVADLGDALGLTGYTASGALGVELRATLLEQELNLAGSATVRDLAWSAPGNEVEPGFGFEDPLVQLDLDVTQRPDASELLLHAIDVRSSFLSGGLTGRLLGVGKADEGAPLVMDGVRGEFTYVPDKLGVVIQPWLPGKLSGAQEERISLALDGELESELGKLDLTSFSRTANGTFELGLGTLVTGGLTAAGRLNATSGEGLTHFAGDLTANGGTLVFDANLRPVASLTEPAGAGLMLDLDAVKATAGLAPFLAHVHPAFAALEETGRGSLEGLLSGNLELHYDGPMTLADLSEGWATLSPEAVSGRGFLKINSAALEGSPLLSEMLTVLGLDARKELELDPVAFEIDAGRLSYDGDWTWKLSGVPTTFGGTIGLDNSLDMTWEVPVVDKLVDRYSFLESLQGQTIEVPLLGTLASPRIEWQAAMDGLAGNAVQSRLDEELAGLFGDDEPEGDPVEMFEEANRLWDEGKLKKARKLYKQIKEDHKDSAVFQDNKVLIKGRIGK